MTMANGFKDYFSGNSNQYKAYRPRYPLELFAYLAELPASCQRAWDCATGTGQSAVMLAGHFPEVIATDASETQIAAAEPCDGVSYRVAVAEESEIADSSIDLVTVAQALHWFDLERFAQEVKRVLRPGGVLAVWSYGLMVVSDPIDKIIHHLYHDILGGYWPKERVMVEQGYKDIRFPFADVPFPEVAMKERWNLHQLLGYLNTWSAVKRYQEKTGNDSLQIVQNDFELAWGNWQGTKEIRWPLVVRVWKKE